MRYLFSVLLALSLSASAKEAPVNYTLVWPSEQSPVLRFTFGKFVKVGSLATQQSYTVDVTAENLWGKPIPNASFEAHFFSKDNVRIGNGYITLNNVGVKETVKFTLPFGATGAQPASLKIVAVNLPKNSVPLLRPGRYG
jgi:hypothetical protein